MQGNIFMYNTSIQLLCMYTLFPIETLEFYIYLYSFFFLLLKYKSIRR